MELALAELGGDPRAGITGGLQFGIEGHQQRYGLEVAGSNSRGGGRGYRPRSLTICNCFLKKRIEMIILLSLRRLNLPFPHILHCRYSGVNMSYHQIRILHLLLRADI